MICLKQMAVAAAIAMSAFGAAEAHTTSLGYVPGANVGEVTFWAGHYSHGDVPGAEGTGTLVGVTNPLYNSGLVSFSTVEASTKPAGLLDGTNNFFWVQTSTGYDFGSGIDPNLFGGVVQWESLTISGLAAGVYDFTIADDARTTQEWANLTNVGGQPGSVRVTLTAGDIGGGNTVPEPASLALFGIAFAGLAASQRKKTN